MARIPLPYKSKKYVRGMIEIWRTLSPKYDGLFASIDNPDPVSVKRIELAGPTQKHMEKYVFG